MAKRVPDDQEENRARERADLHEYVLPGFSFCKAAEAADGMVVLDVFEGTDAESKGIERGNLLLAVAGTEVTGLSAEQVLELIRQTAVGSTVELTFKAEGEPAGLDIPVEVEQLLPDYE